MIFYNISNKFDKSGDKSGGLGLNSPSLVTEDEENSSEENLDQKKVNITTDTSCDSTNTSSFVSQSDSTISPVPETKFLKSPKSLRNVELIKNQQISIGFASSSSFSSDNLNGIKCKSEYDDAKFDQHFSHSKDHPDCEETVPKIDNVISDTKSSSTNEDSLSQSSIFNWFNSKLLESQFILSWIGPSKIKKCGRRRLSKFKKTADDNSDNNDDYIDLNCLRRRRRTLLTSNITQDGYPEDFEDSKKLVQKMSVFLFTEKYIFLQKKKNSNFVFLGLRRVREASEESDYSSEFSDSEETSTDTDTVSKLDNEYYYHLSRGQNIPGSSVSHEPASGTSSDGAETQETQSIDRPYVDGFNAMFWIPLDRFLRSSSRLGRRIMRRCKRFDNKYGCVLCIRRICRRGLRRGRRGLIRLGKNAMTLGIKYAQESGEFLKKNVNRETLKEFWENSSMMQIVRKYGQKASEKISENCWKVKIFWKKNEKNGLSLQIKTLFLEGFF